MPLAADLISDRLLPLIDLHPREEIDPVEILSGLRARPRQLAPKYFYDREGSRLFEEICDLPEYYPTRTEIGILEAHAEEIARRIGPGATLIEYGSGSSRKTRILLDCLAAPALYVPIEISLAALEDAVAGLADEYPELPMAPVRADYMRLSALPPEVEGVVPREGKRALFFPGSTIGNLDPEEAVELLASMRRVAGPGGALVIGADLRKERCVLERAYNDTRGVTAAFNLNILRRLNHELDADFPLDAFAHHAFFNEPKSRIEMHLVARWPLTVNLLERRLEFAQGESLHTENSYKYSAEGFETLLKRAGFAPRARWSDARKWFGVFYCEA
jgi:L-histidine N-alpha-methyltransferase